MNSIKYIRTEIFRVSQGEFARIAGVNQSTISKWEGGGREPELDHMKRIRDEAIGRGMEWSDALFFEPHYGSQQERCDSST